MNETVANARNLTIYSYKFAHTIIILTLLTDAFINEQRRNKKMCMSVQHINVCRVLQTLRFFLYVALWWYIYIKSIYIQCWALIVLDLRKFVYMEFLFVTREFNSTRTIYWWSRHRVYVRYYFRYIYMLNRVNDFDYDDKFCTDIT